MPPPVIAAGITTAGAIGGTLLNNAAAGRAQRDQLKANRQAYLFERQKYADQQRVDAEDRAYRNAVRGAWAERYGVNWSAPASTPSNAMTLGGLARPAAVLGGGTEAARYRQQNPEAAEEYADEDAFNADWNRWR